MPIFLGILGLLFGALSGHLFVMLVFAAGGVWLGFWIRRDSARPEEAQIDPLVKAQMSPDREDVPQLHDLDAVRAEVLSLRQRVALLESVTMARDPVPAVDPASAGANSMEAEPSPQAVAIPGQVLESALPERMQPAGAAMAGPEMQTPAAPEPSGARDLAPAADVASAQPEPTSESPVDERRDVALSQTEPAPATPVDEPRREPGLVARLFSGNIVAKVGVVVLFFGVGFLLKFAYDRNMFPPQLRLLGVALAAVALFATGWWLRESRRVYALILQGGASGLAYLDVFFALKTYQFISPAVGFTLFAALGVATTVAAVRQDARSLAVLGLGGAFLAPVLASTGGGNHVMLFSYYLLLNVFILAVSWFRAWRELNLTGWAFTFIIGLFWGHANYRPELFGSVEPFVLAFFAIYLVVPILFATRQPPQLKGFVDGTLVFGTPAAVAFMQAELVKGMPFGLAWSAAIGSALYALLAALTWRRENMRLLAETYAALAVGLGTLAVFFAFDAYPTFAFWTIEGAAILWVGLRQDRAMARAFAILVQFGGAALFLLEWGDRPRAHWLMNDGIYGCLLIAVASLISARLLYRYADRLRPWETLLGPLMLVWGALWWSIGGMDALYHGVVRANLYNAMALFFLVSFAVAEIAGRWMNWTALRSLTGFHPLTLMLALAAQFYHGQHLLAGLGGLVWPAGFAVAFWSMHRQEKDGIATAAPLRYAGLWLVLGLAATLEEMWLLEHRLHGLGMLFALAAHGAAYLRYRLREREFDGAGAGSSAVLLWAMVFWFAHGYVYAEADLMRPALVSAMLAFVAGTALLYEFAGSLLNWRGLRHAAAVLGLAMPIALLAQYFAGAPHPFASFGWAGWGAAFGAAAFSLHRQVRDGVVIAPDLRRVTLWLLLAVLVTWEEVWLLREREYLYGMLLAAGGHAAACVRFHLHEREATAPSFTGSVALLWAMFFWFAHGYAYGEEHWGRELLVAAMLGLVAASALAYEWGGSALGWRGLRQTANLAWAALPVAYLAQYDAVIHPLASYAWLAWPVAYAVAYWSQYRHERDALSVATPAKHAVGLWLAVAIVALELKWQFRTAQFGDAWLTSIWGFCAAAALACAVFWGDRGRWPVAAHRETYRGLVLGPVGAFTVAWALFANFKAPGSMAPLPYLPLLNPVDAMVGLSLAALWTWSRWYINPNSESTGALRKAAGALGFIWLNGIALRSIHYWAGVPYEFEALYRSVLVQATLSLLWTFAATVLMFLARSRLERSLWVAGAVLLGAVVAKLFLVDLANSGTVERIVSFIGVGALLLVIGYLAPVPPGENSEPGEKPG